MNQSHYLKIHDWIKKEKGPANHCQMCGSNKIPKDRKKWFEWANISGDYKYEISDWVQSCIPCHRIFFSSNPRNPKTKKKGYIKISLMIPNETYEWLRKKSYETRKPQVKIIQEALEQAKKKTV